MADEKPTPRKSRREALYDNDTSVKQRAEKSEKTQRGGAAAPAPAKAEPAHKKERQELARRHENERRDQHGRHRDEHREMQARHEAEHDGAAGLEAKTRLHRKHEHEHGELHRKQHEEHGQMHRRHERERADMHERHEKALIAELAGMHQGGGETAPAAAKAA